MIYFDNAATTYPKPQCVYEAVNEGMKLYSFNAGRGSYKAAKETYKMIENTREKISKVVNCAKNDVIFTSSATESLNNILYGLQLTEMDNIYISPFEHNAVIRPLHALGLNYHLIPFDSKTWVVLENDLRNEFLINKPKIVVLSQISNVTGFELPYNLIFRIAKEFGAITILDAAQGFGIFPIDKTYCDYIVFAGHKSLYAMFGIAGYLKLNNDFLKPYKIGGTGSDSLNPEMPEEKPNKYEAGSQNAVGIYSINKSLDYLMTKDYASDKIELTEYLLSKLNSVNKIKIFLPTDYISCGIVSFAVEGYDSNDVGTILSEEFDICVRTGYHCAPLIHDFINSRKYNGTVRISLGIFNTKEEVDKLINCLKQL